MTFHNARTDEDIGSARTTREKVSKLLSRYPDVSDLDRKEILAFMKEGRHLDIGLLTANDNLRLQLDAFMIDHKRHFRLSGTEVVRGGHYGACTDPLLVTL